MGAPVWCKKRGECRRCYNRNYQRRYTGWPRRKPALVVPRARRERPTSKLLNYLDPTIDVNVGDIFRSESWKKTYFGLGISHRSGIFASSRLLGSVNGGSNYIYAYLESGF